MRKVSMNLQKCMPFSSLAFNALLGYFLHVGNLQCLQKLKVVSLSLKYVRKWLH